MCIEFIFLKTSLTFSGLGANKMSVADLWIGFLHFYAGGFDDARLVVSIRQGFILSYFFESKIYTIDTFRDFLIA